MTQPPIHTSVGEVLRLGIEAMRGLGYSFSLADRLSRMVVWAEAVDGCAFRFVRMEEARIRAGQGGGLALQERQVPGGRVASIDGCGRSILDTGPRAFDLADAGALADGIGLVELRHTFGTALSGELLDRSVQRGAATLLLVGPGRRAGADACFDRPSAWFASPGGRLMKASAPEGAEMDVGAPFGPLVSRLVGSSRGADLAMALDAEAGDDSGLSRMLLIGMRAPAADQRETYQAAFADAALAAGFDLSDDADQRWERAQCCGFKVDRSDWDNLLALIQRTRVATSERSLHHAG